MQYRFFEIIETYDVNFIPIRTSVHYSSCFVCALKVLLASIKFTDSGLHLHQISYSECDDIRFYLGLKHQNMLKS